MTTPTTKHPTGRTAISIADTFGVSLRKHGPVVDNTTTLRPLDVVMLGGECWIVESTNPQFDGRALVAAIYQPDMLEGATRSADGKLEGGTWRGRIERTVCYWRAPGETRPLAWSEDETLLLAGWRHDLNSIWTTRAAVTREEARRICAEDPSLVYVDAVEVAEVIRDEQIEVLRQEAGQHGDREMVAICDGALLRGTIMRGRYRVECARVIADARARS